MNRRGMQVCSRHVHEVAMDILGNKFRQGVHVDVIKIPPALLQEIRDFHKSKAETDKFWPRSYEKIEYVCLTKNHLVHAMKLMEKEKCNLGNDEVAQDNIDKGMLCQVFNESLFQDQVAMDAISHSDNLCGLLTS